MDYQALVITILPELISKHWFIIYNVTLATATIEFTPVINHHVTVVFTIARSEFNLFHHTV